MVRVNPAGCASCESEWLASSKQAEGDEQQRLAQLRVDNMSGLSHEIWEYGMRMNDTQRQELALTPDVELRNFIINSCTPPTPLMESVYNATMTRVPYEQACYICGPEQAMLLRTLVGLARPRRALDIGSFTGYGSSAIVEALPSDAELTCLEIDRAYTRLAAQTLAGRPATFMVGQAMDALKRFEEQGRQFDFISLDADKPLHGEYYNMSLRLLRPGGVLIMFGMLLFPTIEDQEAMEKLHEILPNDTRITTAQLPVGCGIQLMVKLDGLTPHLPLSEQEVTERRKWRLESELAAIDRYVDSLGKPLGGAGSSGPGTEALSSSGLVALAAARRQAEAAAAPPVE
jgi:predicted O-methyltransferase YrrM